MMQVPWHSSQVQVSVLSDEEVPLYISNFGTDVCEGPGCNGDIDGDGDVDGLDLLFLASEIHQDKE